MAPELRPETANRLATADPWKGVVFAATPMLFHLGMFDAQAWVARDEMLGRVDVPDEAARRADVEARVAAEDAVPDDWGAIRHRGDDVRELIAETDCPDIDIDIDGPNG